MAESENLNEFLGNLLIQPIVESWSLNRKPKSSASRERSLFQQKKVLLDEEIIFISCSSLKVSRIVALIFCNYFRVGTVDFKEEFE